MKPYDIRRAYGEMELAEVHQLYRDFEDKEALDSNNYDDTLLHIAAAHADVEAITILLEAGLTPKPNKYGDTPLHTLAEQKRSSGYKVKPGDTRAAALKLLEARLSPLRKDDEGQTCLHVAARWGRHEFFEAMVENGAKLDMANKNGNTPLHIICEYSGRAASSLHYAEEGLARSRETAARETHRIYQEQLASAEENYARHKAEFDGYFLSAKALIEAGLDVDEKNNYGQDALFMLNENDRRGDKRIAALIGGYYTDEAAEGSADAGAEAALRLKTGGMGLHLAIEKEDRESVAANIALGADVNELFNDGNTYNKLHDLTPLGAAIFHLDEESAKMLLEAGADPNLKNSSGKTPFTAFFNARVHGKIFENKIPGKILTAMKEHGLNIDDFINEELDTALNACCRNLGHASGYNHYRMPGVLMELLLDWGADINLANAKGVTPLMNISACDEGSSENFQITLLEAGAQVNARDAEGNTPLMYAARHRNKATAKNMADMLFSFGDPEPQAVNNAGISALEVATEKDNEPLVKYLLGKM